MKRVLTAAALDLPSLSTVLLRQRLAILRGGGRWWRCFAITNTMPSPRRTASARPGPIGYGAGLAAACCGAGTPGSIVLAAALIAFALSMRVDDLAHALPRSALLVTGVVYIFGAWKCAIRLHAVNPHWLMYALMVNWVGDIGAYYVGRSFGKHRLAERVSPKKSWEGAVASVVTAVLIAGAYLVYFVPGVGIVEAIVLTAAANAAGQLGDLCESAMKRGAGVKDSGVDPAGPRRILDRVDSTLFSLPVVYAFALLKTQTL